MDQQYSKNDLSIIIDTDPGTDDALALAVASVFFKDNIRAVISTFGNVDGEQTLSNLVNLGHLLEIKCPILHGSLNPLGHDFSPRTDFHGENGLCGLVLPSVKRPSYAKSYLEKIYTILKSSSNVKYVAIAPLTNLSKLVDMYPDVIYHIDELIVMGGGFNVFNMEHNTEFNFCLDPVAAKKVLSLPIKTVLAPLDMTYKMAFSLKDIEDIVGIGREYLPKTIDNPYTVMSSLFYSNYYTSIRHHDPGSIIHDTTTLAYLINKSKCVINHFHFSVDEYGALSKKSGDCEAFVIEDIDRNFLFTLLKETFQNINPGGSERIKQIIRGSHQNEKTINCD